MNTTIREAGVEDAPLVHKLIRELAEFEKLAHEVEATEELLCDTLLGAQSDAHVVIAEADGEPAGFAVFFFNYSTFIGRPGLYIEDLYVKPSRRGEGVGKALFSHCARVACEKKCGRLEFSVLNWNPARRFYERLGARTMDDWVIYRLTGAALENATGL